MSIICPLDSLPARRRVKLKYKLIFVVHSRYWFSPSYPYWF